MRRGIVASMAVCVPLLVAAPAHAAFPGPNGNVTFLRVTTVCGDPNPCRLENIRNTTGLEYGRGTHPAWSADGQRLAFADGTDIYSMKPDGSDRKLVLDWNQDVEGIAWAPSGDRLAAALVVCDQAECRTDIHVIDLGPSGSAAAVVDITPDLYADNNPAWSPGGNRIAFDTTRDGNNDVYTMDVNGGSLTRLTTSPAGDSDPNWAPSGDALAFTSTRDGTDAIYTMESNGANQTRRTGLGAGVSRQPAWSPDGRYIVFSGVRGQWGFTQLVTITADGSSEFPHGGGQGEADYEPDWQQAVLSYPRPKAASPLRVPLVPSYAPCSAPNRAHGPPLAFGSCNPPAQTSPHLTVGTPDANGAAANSVGSVRLTTIVEPICCYPNDIGIDIALNDVRCVATGTNCSPANDRAGADYTGELSAELVVQLTDKWIPGDPQTTQEFTFPIRIPCSASSSTAIGAACSVDTYANAVLPGSVRDGPRAIWQMRKVRVFDGGADGDADTVGDNHPFASQGIFVP